MIFQAAPPDTTIYMIGGYVFIFGVLILYVASLMIRRRNLRREHDLLAEIEAREYEDIGGEAVST